MAGLRAGVLYALIVFLIGFVFGTARILLVVPQMGETAAVSLEAPLMLAASWFVCGWSIHRIEVPRTIPARALMGVVAFAVLMMAEFGLSVLVFGRSAGEHLASYALVPRLIGLAAQIVFATFPVVQVWRQ